MENTPVAAAVAMSMRWRQGMKLGRTLYAQHGDQPSEFDTLIGMLDNCDLARHVVKLHNWWIDGDELPTERGL